MKTVRTFSVMEREALVYLQSFGGRITYAHASEYGARFLQALRQLTKRKRNGKVGVTFRDGSFRLAVAL